jgi:hypothetical protein
MTMFSKNRVIDNLREEKKKLKDKLEAVKNALTEEYNEPKGVPVWGKPDFTAYDYEDGDAKDAINAIAKILAV